MKKIFGIIGGVIILCITFGLLGCAKEIKSITDFSQFSDMTRDETDRIEVTFDNGSGSPFYFTVDDKSDIDEIMDIIFSSSFENIGKETNDGCHTTIVIVQGENEYNMHVAVNRDGKYCYAFSTDDLQNAINKLAENAGAYENAE